MRSARTTVALLLAASTSAAAGTLVTPGLEKENDGAFRCFVVNAGTKPFGDTTLEIRDSGGNALASVDATGLLPGRLELAGVEPPSAALGYCVLDGKFSRKKARLSFCALRLGTIECAAAVSGF